MTTHTQVLLELNGQQQIAWIPTRAAQKGYQVELKEDGQFWNVGGVFDLTVDDSVIKANERRYLNHRKATDI